MEKKVVCGHHLCPYDLSNIFCTSPQWLLWFHQAEPAGKNFVGPTTTADFGPMTENGTMKRFRPEIDFPKSDIFTH